MIVRYPFYNFMLKKYLIQAKDEELLQSISFILILYTFLSYCILSMKMIAVWVRTQPIWMHWVRVPVNQLLQQQLMWSVNCCYVFSLLSLYDFILFFFSSGINIKRTNVAYWASWNIASCFICPRKSISTISFTGKRVTWNWCTFGNT